MQDSDSDCVTDSDYESDIHSDFQNHDIHSDFENHDIDEDSDSIYDGDDGDNLTEEEGIGLCSICNITLKNNPDIKCNICMDDICMKCVAITEYVLSIDSDSNSNFNTNICIICYDKECQECTTDISEQFNNYLEENELPLDIEKNSDVLNCKECYKKYYLTQ